MGTARILFRSGLVLTGFLTACQAAPKDEPLLSKKSPLEMRAIQSRAFETTDSNAMLRAVIATMQDLGYSIEKVEASAGTVTATKLAVLKMSASSYPHGSTQTIVRANALIKVGLRLQQVDAPEFYEKDFFDPLAKTVALQAKSAPAEDGDGATATYPGPVTRVPVSRTSSATNLNPTR